MWASPPARKQFLQGYVKKRGRRLPYTSDGRSQSPGMYQCLLIVSPIFIIFNQASSHLPNSRCLLVWYQELHILSSPWPKEWLRETHIRRWSGRCLVQGGFVHGSLWIRNHHLQHHYWTVEGVLRNSLSRPARVILLGFIETC